MTLSNLPGTTITSGMLARRSLFFLLLLLLTLANLFTLFRGLNSQQAMDQAQIGREIARHGTFTTKFIRPVAYWQAEQGNQGTVPFESFRDTYHAPLYPLVLAAVLKLVGADDPDNWQMGENDMIFPLDRVVATVSTLFFLMSIGVCYLLAARIFDAKIAGTTAVLMLFCELFWNFSLSGLPQMLMLLLFSSGLYFAYRATEASQEGRVPMVPALAAGLFFTLLSLTHWLGLWIALGFIVYAAIVFRPRGVIAAAITALLVIGIIVPLMQADRASNSPFGTAFLVLYNGLANGSESVIMRLHNLEEQPLSLDGLLFKVLRLTLLQGTDILPFLGGIVAAPLFFISLLHPFKRPSIASFRWAICLMWVLAALGMALFGIDAKGTHPNQIHLLFAPVMTAYGLAFLSILWSRLEIPGTSPFVNNAHLIAVVILSSLPLLLALPQKIKIGMFVGEKGLPQWPPYFPPALANGIKKWVEPNQIIVSDQPWAVAWYADRMSLWLPAKRPGFEKFENRANDLKNSFAGILISPSSHGFESLSQVATEYGDFTSMVIDGRAFLSTQPQGVSLFDKDPKISAIAKRYPYRATLVGMDMVFYSDRPLRSVR